MHISFQATLPLYVRHVPSPVAMPIAPSIYLELEESIYSPIQNLV